MGKLIYEIIRFGVVGFISFLFDWGTMMLVLHAALGSERTEVNVAVSTALGFAVGVTVNYLLSVKFVFTYSANNGYGKDNKSKVLFLFIALIGLAINQILMVLGVAVLSYNETIVKIEATLVVMVWNYISRKVFIFKDK